MKVFVLEASVMHEGSEVIGVFLSEESLAVGAEEFKKKYVNNEYHYDWLFVKEFDTDVIEEVPYSYRYYVNPSSSYARKEE